MKEINNLRLNKYFTLPPLKLQSINLKQCCDITELKQYSCLCKFLKYTKKNWSRLKMHLRKDELFRTSVQVSNLYTHIHIYIWWKKLPQNESTKFQHEYWTLEGAIQKNITRFLRLKCISLRLHLSERRCKGR